MKHIKLNIGCGKHKKDGYINIDISPKYKPDIVASATHLPFKSNSVDEIYTSHMVEHVPNFEKAMREMHRILKPGGKLYIVVPYSAATSAYLPQHMHYFSWDSFLPFKNGHEHDDYYNFTFRDVKNRLVFEYTNKIISRIANDHPLLYERTFLSKLFPAIELHVEMIK